MICLENNIREYGSTLYVGKAREKNGRPYISIASDELKSLVIYRYKNNKNIFKKMKENVGISKPKKHTNKIGMVPLAAKLK